MATRLASVVPCFAVLTLAFAGCRGADPNPPVGVPPGVGLGGACGSVKCRSGLVCDEGTSTCRGGGASTNGTACTLGVECQSGTCGPNGTRGQCVATGTGTLGTSCQGDGDCAAPLKCGFDGQSLFPLCLTAGTLDYGASCTRGLECAQGLLCIASKCTPAPLPAASTPHGYPPVIPPTPGTGWAGASCTAAKSSAETALFVLPRAEDDAAVLTDFYRLPFPNDALRGSNGRIDFSRHPHDTAPLFGFDVLARYLEVLAPEPFGNAPTMVLRFDGPIDFASLGLSAGSDTKVRLVKLVPGEGGPHGFSLQFDPNGNRYTCPNWLAVRPYDGDSLTAGPWALVLFKGIKGSNGAEVAPSADFTAMLQSTTPSDARQAQAWLAYTPLREWMDEQNVTAGQLINAAVFTVGEPKRLMKRLATAVETAPVASFHQWTKCGGSQPSPCPDTTGPRACGTSTAFDEWHAMVELPIFQQGTAPYLAPAQGGGIDSSSSALTPVRTESVCATLTTPRGDAPDGGWPLVLYAHGTGGTFRGHAGDGAAAAMAGITLPGSNEPVRAAVLGFDQVGHGPRRGADAGSATPEDIVFNFANPASARGTMAQGATDLLALSRVVESWEDGGPPELPALDTRHVVFWGHSQGATEGALFLGVDRRVDSALLTGASATLVNSLTSKKAPINIADGMWVALSESSPQAVHIYHPVLSLLQMWTDPVDPLHFAARVVTQPVEGTSPAFARNVFQVWGKDDLFTPRPVQTSFALGARLALVGPKVDTFEVTEVASVSGNVTLPGPVTAAVRQYAPDGYDGHFVVFNHPTAKTDASRFVGRCLLGQTPRIPEP